ncbi:DUF1131 family protein [Sodalis sp.]
MPITLPAVEEMLGGDYRLCGDIETRDGDVISVYQAMNKGQVKLTVYEPS